MADWQKLLKTVLLADGLIDAKETNMLKSELFSDGVIDNDEMDFLVDLRNSSAKCSDEFNTLFFEALASNVLADGIVDADEVVRIRNILFSDGVIDEDEKEFLNILKSRAKSLSPEFESLYRECMK